jgi:acylphosphatase
MPSRAHVYVSGRVQGVGFRASTRREASRVGVDGWVTNLADGRVEAVFEGDRASVDAMVEWCRSGPETARVEATEVHREDPVGLDGFEIRR